MIKKDERGLRIEGNFIEIGCDLTAILIGTYESIAQEDVELARAMVGSMGLLIEDLESLPDDVTDRDEIRKELNKKKDEDIKKLTKDVIKKLAEEILGDEGKEEK